MKRKSINDGDLVARFYFGSQKLSWEIKDGEQKKKIEISWSQISAITAAFPQNEPSVLEIQLRTPPSLLRESVQERGHYLGNSTSDFTAQQVSICRRHSIKFRKAKFKERHYEKLLQCNEELLALSQKPFPYSESPYFESAPAVQISPSNIQPSNVISQVNTQPGYAPAMQFSPSNIEPSYAPAVQTSPSNIQPSYVPELHSQLNTQPGYAPAEQFPQSDTERQLPVLINGQNQMLQLLMPAVNLNSSILPYTVGRENQVREWSPYANDPTQADHALHQNALILPVQGHLLSDHVGPVHAQHQFPNSRSLLLGGGNNIVQTDKNYNMEESMRETNANTNNSWNSEHSEAEIDVSYYLNLGHSPTTSSYSTSQHAKDHNTSM